MCKQHPLLQQKGGSHANTMFCCEANQSLPGFVTGHLLVHSIKITGASSRWGQCGSYRDGIFWISSVARALPFICARPSVGHVPSPAQGTCLLSLLRPTADTRNQLPSCFLQPVLPVINDYTMFTNNSQLSLKDTYTVDKRNHIK